MTNTKIVASVTGYQTYDTLGKYKIHGKEATQDGRIVVAQDSRISGGIIIGKMRDLQLPGDSQRWVLGTYFDSEQTICLAELPKIGVKDYPAICVLHRKEKFSDDLAAGAELSGEYKGIWHSMKNSGLLAFLGNIPLHQKLGSALYYHRDAITNFLSHYSLERLKEIEIKARAGNECEVALRRI